MNVRWLTLLVCVIVAVGCGGRGDKGKKKDDRAVIDPNQDVPPTPKISEQGIDQKDVEAAELKPVDPVHFSKLVELLPLAPEGFQAKEPHGQTVAVGGFKISTAECSYEAKDKRLKVSIADGANNPAYYASFTAVSKLAIETADGYQRGISIDGYPAFEKLDKDKTSQLMVLVARRYLVTLDGQGVAPELLRDTFISINLTKLASLK